MPLAPLASSQSRRDGLSPMVAGCMAGFTSRVVGSPIDVIKIRMQLAASQKDSPPRLIETALDIRKRHGFRAFWNGHIPAQILSVSFGAVQFGVYEYLDKTLPVIDSRYYPSKFVTGGLAGIAATVTVYPVDIIRTRFVMQPTNPKVYGSIIDAASSMVRVGGIRGLYGGVVPAAMAVFPNTGLQFAYINVFTQVFDKYLLPNHDVYAWKYFICGSGAGLLSKLTTLPLDIMRKRLQVQGFQDHNGIAHPRFSSVWECCSTTYQQGGLRGFYRGGLAGSIKALVVSGVTFAVYEKSLELIDGRV